MNNATESPIGKKFRVRKLERYDPVNASIDGPTQWTELMRPLVGEIGVCEVVNGRPIEYRMHFAIRGVSQWMNPDWLEPVADEPSTPTPEKVDEKRYLIVYETDDGRTDTFQTDDPNEAMSHGKKYGQGEFTAYVVTKIVKFKPKWEETVEFGGTQ